MEVVTLAFCFCSLGLLFPLNCLGEYAPGDLAPAFRLQTLNGPLIYKRVNETNIKPPILFHEFTNHSGFLEALWGKDSSLLELIDRLPANTQLVFMTSANSAEEKARWMQARFKRVLGKYFELAEEKGRAMEKEEVGEKRLFRHYPAAKETPVFFHPHRAIDRRSISDDNVNDNRKEKSRKRRSRKSHQTPRESSMKRSIVADKAMQFGDDEFAYVEVREEIAATPQQVGKEEFIKLWMKRLHFVTIPVFQLGNWIPLVSSRWYCTGHGCGLDQVAVESEEEGDMKFVTKRLDARYDWLPSVYTLKAKYPRVVVRDYGTGCKLIEGKDVKKKVILVSRSSCSFYAKAKIAEKAGALAFILYSDPNTSLVDMTCQAQECSSELKVPGTMIPFDSGKKILQLIEGGGDIYVRFQHSPTRNFFLAIDQQGKLQEVGWLLYPSMVFLAYQAQWLNYMTSVLRNVSTPSKVIKVFNFTVMQGKKGVVRTITVPPLQVLQKYKNAYIDMSLSCPGETDVSCPHWDHTVQLYICCDKGPLCGEELGRWITPFRRRIGRWLTPIRPLLPLFTSTKCTFTMKTVPWAMAWKPSLTLRFTGKNEHDSKEDNMVPYKIRRLFRGGKFDKNYNKGYKPIKFVVPSVTTKVKIVAVITGHGSDNNNCAEFCVTSHHFVVNEKYINSRIFNNAGTPYGCADRVPLGVEPNEHGTWLYGRDGWCDGQDVAPWVQDISDQVTFDGDLNTISYHGYFNGTDPNPEENPGYIIMHSFLVFYKAPSMKEVD